MTTTHAALVCYRCGLPLIGPALTWSNATVAAFLAALKAGTVVQGKRLGSLAHAEGCRAPKDPASAQDMRDSARANNLAAYATAGKAIGADGKVAPYTGEAKPAAATEASETTTARPVTTCPPEWAADPALAAAWTDYAARQVAAPAAKPKRTAPTAAPAAPVVQVAAPAALAVRVDESMLRALLSRLPADALLDAAFAGCVPTVTVTIGNREWTVLV